MSDPNQPGRQPGPSGSDGTPESAQPPPEPPPQPAYQPPYGQAGAQWPYSQPAGQQPYGGPGRPAYGPYPPAQPQGGGAKVWLLVIGLVLLLTCGGCFAVGALVLSQTGDVLREIEDSGGPGNGEQVSVEPGEAFELGDLSFAEGWAVTAQGPVVTIDGLVATTSEETDVGGLALFLTFFRKGREVAQATCAGTVGSAGEEIPLDCFVTDRRARHADQVTVQSAL